MADGTQVWHEALSKFRSQLSKAEQDKFDRFAGFECLLEHLAYLQEKYSQRKSSKFFDKIKTALESIWNFNTGVQSFVQAGPDGFAFAWGSISIVLQIALNYTRGLEMLADCLASIGQALPRVEQYRSRLKQLPGDFVRHTLLQYYLELLGFCKDAITFFTSSIRRNVLRSSWRSWQKARLSRIRDLLATLDQEVGFALSSGTFDLVKNIKTTQFGAANMFVGNLPYENLPARNHSFFGRELELGVLSSGLLENKRCDNGCKCVGLHGLAGSGKTQIALEHAHRTFQSNLYQAVLWISAETEVKLLESFASIAKGLGLLSIDAQRSHEQQKQAVLQWLNQSNAPAQGNRRVDWLIIFDNASDPGLLKKYWPRTQRGSIIVTCRSPEFANKFSKKRLNVESFNSTSAPQFLLSVIGSDSVHTAQDTELALKIANAVGQHPLTLNLVGSYIRCCGKSLEDFVRDHPDFDRNLVFRDDLHVEIEGINQRSVSDAFALNASTTGPQPMSEESRNFMSLLAFLDPDGAPLELFVPHSKAAMLCDGPDEPDNVPRLEQLLGNPFENTLTFDLARKKLLDRALISMDDTNRRMKCHRLVRIATERQLAPEEISKALNKLVFLLNASFPAQVDGQALLSQWERCSKFASSVVSVLEACMRHLELVNQPALLSEVVCRCSWYYYEQGQFATASWLADQAIKFCENVLDRGNHPGYSTWYVKDMISHQVNTKGAIGSKIPSVDHGLRMYERVFDIRVENKREGNAEDEMWIGAAMGNLAVPLMANGRAQDALPLLLELVQREDMKTNRDVYWSNLCLCLELLGQYDEALIASKMAEDSIERQWAKDDIRMAGVKFYVSKILEKQGHKRASLEVLQTCLSIRQKAMRHHPETALTLHRMGVLLGSMGSFKSAVQCLHFAMEMLCACECHPGAICRALLELVRLLERSGDVENIPQYLELADGYRRQITDVDTSGFSGDPAEYDRFVTVGLR